MANKLEFREKLSGIVELGKEQNSSLTTADVEKYFEDDQLSEEQMGLVYDYLLSQKIAVKGYEMKGGTVIDSNTNEEKAIPYTDEETSYLKDYEKDLSEIIVSVDQMDAAELIALYEKVMQGDAMAKSALISAYLPKVVEISKSLHHSQIFIGDMIQEGNVGLMLTLDQLSSTETAHEEICDGIRQAIQMSIEEIADLKSRDQAMVEKVRFLDESITKLTEEYGRKVTIDELSLYMEMSEEDVLDILKLAGEDIDEEESTHE